MGQTIIGVAGVEVLLDTFVAHIDDVKYMMRLCDFAICTYLQIIRCSGDSLIECVIKYLCQQ